MNGVSDVWSWVFPWLISESDVMAVGRCESSLLGSVRQAQDPTCTFSDEMSLLPGEGGPFRKPSTINGGGCSVCCRKNILLCDDIKHLLDEDWGRLHNGN